MFKKIVSNLPFSPALVGQLGFYTKRLKKEEVTRKMGLIFVVLALIVQSLAVFQPPEAANASSASDMVYGGVSSLSNYLKIYDANTKNIKDVMNQLQITRSEIAATKYSSWKGANKLSWGFASGASYAQGERQMNIRNSSGKVVTTVYYRPQSIRQGTTKDIWGWVGHSKSRGWFAIMKDCGNLVTEIKPTPTEPVPTKPTKCIFNPKLLASDSNCKACPGNESIWIDDLSCQPNIVKSKVATNLSQNFVKADSVYAKATDRISYTINVRNTGLKSASVEMKENLADILEYSNLIDNGGGTFNASTSELSWPDINLKPSTQQSRTFVVKIKDQIPITAQGISNPMSYDCTVTNVFGNAIDIKIDCPTPKVVEKVVTDLPQTGPTENMVFIGVVLAVTTYFYARTRQVKKEIKLIRRDAISGTI